MKIVVGTAAQIVLLGRDKMLAKTRKWILEGCGYQAYVAFNLPDMERIAFREPVDLFLLCDSLAPEARVNALASIHQQWPKVKLLVLASTRSAIALHASEPIFLSLDGPARLVETLHTMLAAHAVALPDWNIKPDC